MNPQLAGASDEQLLSSLTGYELLGGILGNAKSVSQFPDQAIYKLIEGLKQEYPHALKYVSFRKLGGTTLSPEIEQYLRFFRIGKIIRLSSMPNPVVQFYRISETSRDSLRRDLKQRGVSEEQNAILKRISDQFEEIVSPSEAEAKAATATSLR